MPDQHVGEAMRKSGVTVHKADIAAYREATKAFYTESPNWAPDLVTKVREASR